MPIFTVGVLIAVIAAIVALGRTKDPVRRARSLRKAGLILMMAFSAFIAAFIVGETFTDPGGWKAVGYVATWLVPVAALAWLAWFRPGPAVIASAALLVGVFVLDLWSAVASDAWRSFEDSVGPVRAIITFAIAAPLALLGWKRPFAAGAMLLLMMVPPTILVATGTGAIGGALLVAASPGSVTGVLYLFAARLERGGSELSLGARGGPPIPTASRVADESMRDYVKARKPIFH